MNTNEPVAIVNTNCENNIQWNVLKPQSYNGYFLYTTPQTKPLDYQEVINSLKELIAPKEPDWDCSYWNQAIERCILNVEMIEAKVRGEK
jgi:hypothetical protein